MIEPTDDSTKCNHFFIKAFHLRESYVELAAVRMGCSSIAVPQDPWLVMGDSEGFVLEVAVVDGDPRFRKAQLNETVLFDSERLGVSESKVNPFVEDSLTKFQEVLAGFRSYFCV